MYLCTVSETTAMLYIGNFASVRIKSHLQEFKVNLLNVQLCLDTLRIVQY